MARGSGPAGEHLIEGSFTHQPSKVQYRIYREGGRAWMSFERASSNPADALAGRRELLYSVGSGTHGRTFLYQVEGHWFQLPVNYYRKRDQWDMAPGFGASVRMPASLPVDPNCIHCHATEIEKPLAEAPNLFAERPFDQGGIGCSACHGDSAMHIATGGKGKIVNPAKLSALARDSVCLQCHLEGDAVVYRSGRAVSQFQAGNLLSEFAVYFVRTSEAGGGRRAASQYEALSQSACKRASGDKLTCTTCHDPHSDPSPEERVAFYRARCLGCHTSPAIATRHHPDQPDCALCHMPARLTFDISHEQVTDHNIERKPTKEDQQARNSGPKSLMALGGASVGDRELGLAYAQLAHRGDREAGERARDLLLKAELGGTADEQVHVNLGFLEQAAGDLEAARAEYAATLQANAYSTTALSNSAFLEARSGASGEALRLLQRVVAADPRQTEAGLILAELQCRMGETSASRALAERLRDFNPDVEDLKMFLKNSNGSKHLCR